MQVITAIFRAPFRVVARGVSSSMRSAKDRAFSILYQVNHTVEYRERGPGLAEFVALRPITMEVLQQQMFVSSGGRTMYDVYFRYRGAPFVARSAEKIIRNGDIIRVEFRVGDGLNDFRISDDFRGKLPSYVFIFWEKKGGPGTITWGNTA